MKIEALDLFAPDEFVAVLHSDRDLRSASRQESAIHRDILAC